jgi:hypothetical protein
VTFQNMCSIFKCTHEESLALWDYLMFLRVKDMLRQPPLPAITEKDMEFEKSREASPLTTQRWVADTLGVPVELTNIIAQDNPKVHPMTQQWYDDVEAIAQGKPAPGDTAPTLAECTEQLREDLKKEKAAALAFKLTGEPPYQPSLREAERNKYMQAHIDSWKNSVIAHSKEYAISGGISPIDLQMIRCDRCNAELHFGRVPDGTDIVCHSCGYMTKFKSEGDALVDKTIGVRRRAAGKLFVDDFRVILCEKCQVELNFCSPCSRVDVTCYACGHLNQWIDVGKEEKK